ncbi:MAG: asparagine synthase (glutamine-hydrolyzing) [Pyrinomonadaceae bacterium]
MCGIVGIAGDLSREECLEVVGRMNDSIIHRGPDDDGVWAETGFGFGMRRLSIIDLTGGKQPIWDRVDGRGIVFNGEVYNYRALRADLIDRGVGGWTTESDTEVVLKSLVTDGEKGIQQWNGMFAAATWDPATQNLLLIRDRMGVKPLYYYWDGKNFLFASEIKAILRSGLVERRIDKQALWDYLTYRYVPGPGSIWQNVKKLPPGHLLRLKPGCGPQIERYWESDVVSTERAGLSESEIDAEFAELFLDAVELRLVASDVPVGVFLSGGLDSSAIAAAAVELGHRNFHTFSVGFEEGGYYSELSFARQVADHVGARYHEVVLDQKRFLDLLPEVIYATDEPMADLSAIPVLALSRLARKDVKVVLSGEGSDEILAGYDFDRAERDWDRARLLQRFPRRALRAGAAVSRLGPGGLYRRAAKIANSPLENWNRAELPHITRHFGQADKRRMFPGEEWEDSDRIVADRYASTASRDPLQQMLAVYQRDWLVEDLLMKADKATMAASLEARTPFLDYRLVEWANRQPNSVKVKRRGLNRYETKSVLRRFCSKRLPRSIIERPKRGFPDPANVWLGNGLHPWAHEILCGSQSKLGNAIEKPIAEEFLNAAKAGSNQAANSIWTLIVLELWLQAWDVTTLQ